METNIKEAPVQHELSKDILAKVKIKRIFEIFVEEFDEEGGPGHTPAWRPVKVDPTLGGSGGNPTITVMSRDDLQEKRNFYSKIGQRFKIVREIDPPSMDMLYKAAVEQGLVKDDPGKAKSTPQHDVQTQTQSQTQPGMVSSNSDRPAPKHKPKIITIGDMQIKYDGDRVYQKQWIRLTPEESANFRVVNDASNKIVSLNGKHIEAKRWTLVENSSSEDDMVEEMINA